MKNLLRSIAVAGAFVATEARTLAETAYLTLVRNKFTEQSTGGNLYLRGEFKGHTLELPWKDNQKGKSCIPAGRYKLRKRSASESRRFKYPHLLVEEVSGREYILFHVGNYPRDTKGCILVGSTNGKDFVGSSREAFSKLMASLEDCDEIKLQINERR